MKSFEKNEWGEKCQFCWQYVPTRRSGFFTDHFLLAFAKVQYQSWGIVLLHISFPSPPWQDFEMIPGNLSFDWFHSSSLLWDFLGFRHTEGMLPFSKKHLNLYFSKWFFVNLILGYLISLSCKWHKQLHYCKTVICVECVLRSLNTTNFITRLCALCLSKTKMQHRHRSNRRPTVPLGSRILTDPSKVFEHNMWWDVSSGIIFIFSFCILFTLV